MKIVVAGGIDVVELLRRRNPRLARRIPSPGASLLWCLARGTTL
ncbi:MAG: hypothetical protein ACLFR8_06395 [Alkalispirochaeta sp.]